MDLPARVVSPWLTVAVGLAAVVLEVIAATLLDDSLGFVVAANVYMVVLVAATLVTWTAARVGDVTERTSWRVTAFALSLLVMGSGVSATAGILGMEPVVALGALLRLASTVFFVHGLWLLPKGPNPKGASQYVVDAGIAVSCFLLLAWVFFHDRVSDVDGFGMGFVSAVRPVADAMLGTAAVMALVTGRSAGGVALPRLVAAAGGVLLIGVGDASTALAFAAHGHPTALSLAPGSVGVVMIAWAVVSSDDGAGRQLVHRLVVASTSPLIPVLSACAVVVYLVQKPHRVDPVSLGLVILSLVFVIAALVHGRLSSFETREQMERKVSERTMQIGTRERWFQALVQNSSDVVTVIGTDGIVRYQTPSVRRVLGHDPGSVVGSHLSSLMEPADVVELERAVRRAEDEPGSVQLLEFPLRRAGGGWQDTETMITSLVDEPHVRGIVLNTRDVSERRRLQKELLHQAYSDALTGLANRTLFRDRTGEALDRADPSTVGVLFLDLNGFKAVNDTLGHAVGDQLLTLVGQRLTNAVRPGDLVARLGGDEFGILVVGDRAEHAASWVAERVVGVLEHDFELDGRKVPLGVAIGIALNDRGTETADQLLSNADLAMYRSKSTPGTRHVRFEESMHEEMLARVQAEADLREAVEQQRLSLHFQPIVDLSSGRPVGVEALARWAHPVRGMVQPTEFIDVAEQIGLVDRIGEWAIRECCRHAARWRTVVGGSAFRVAVNVSAHQLRSDFPHVVRRALEDAAVTGEVLTLEVTESALMDRPEEAAAILAEVKRLGVRVAVDDFGTGYSSLSYLSRFPVDVLKIDRSFIEHVTTASDKSELARTIVELAGSLGLTTIAEGIETGEQRSHLLDLGCRHGQGYLFARPMTAEAVDAYLSSTAPGGGRTGASPAAREGALRPG